MNITSAAVNAGSFRDRDGRVYHYQDRVFRGLSAVALDNYQQLLEQPFYQKLTEVGKNYRHPKTQNGRKPFAG